jgi:hypothetical protein
VQFLVRHSRLSSTADTWQTILSPTVHEQLLVHSCAMTFVVSNDEVNSAAFPFLQRLVSKNESVIQQLSQKSLVVLRRLLFSTALERSFFGL